LSSPSGVDFNDPISKITAIKESFMLIEAHDKARRLARTIVSDIALYNKDEIRRGIQNDTLFDDLSEELERGRKLYNSRVVPELQANANFYNQAIVDVLVKPSGSIESDIW